MGKRQADAAPVAWMYDDGEGQLALSFSQSHAKYPYWTETPLYAAPVADRGSTSSPVADRETPETSDKLRDAVEVWKDAYEAWCNPPPHLAFSESAAAVIEADRAALVAEIVAWLRQPRTGMGYVGQHLAEQIEAKWGKA